MIGRQPSHQIEGQRNNLSITNIPTVSSLWPLYLRTELKECRLVGGALITGKLC